MSRKEAESDSCARSTALLFKTEDLSFTIGNQFHFHFATCVVFIDPCQIIMEVTVTLFWLMYSYFTFYFPMAN